jgi:hypothetical protein
LFDEEQATLAGALNDLEKLVHRADFLELLGDEPLKERGGNVVILFERGIHQAIDKTRDFNLLIEREFHGILGEGKARDRLCDGRNLNASSGIDEKFDELHRVFMLFASLFVKLPCEKGERFGVKVRCDGRVLDACRELVTNLLVDFIVEDLGNQHASKFCACGSKVKPQPAQAAANLLQWTVRQRHDFSE